MNIKETIARLAIAKVAKPKNFKTVRETLVAGEYDVDFIARFKGKINVGDSYNQKIVAKADPWKLLAVAMSKLNDATVHSILIEAEEDKNREIVVIASKKIKDIAEGAIVKLKASTSSVCQGKTTGNVELSVESAKIAIN